MKKLIPFACLLLTTFFTKAQSSFPCTFPDSLAAYYQDDADKVTIEYSFEQDLHWKDSVRISPGLSDTVLNALLAVHEAMHLPARDTVVALLDIHYTLNFIMTQLSLQADTALPWVQALAGGNLNTGSAPVDSMINMFGISRGSYIKYRGSHVSMSLTTQENYNQKALAAAFEALPGVIYAQENVYLGFGDYIKMFIGPNYVELTYSHGWGDCPLGCIHRRYWEFRVYDNCSVQYMGSYGDVLPADVSVKELGANEIEVAPNPFSDYIGLGNVPANSTYTLYNAMGQKVQQGPVANDKIAIERQLARGSYYLILTSKGSRLGSYRLIRE